MLPSRATLIYGANGYTGELIARRAVESGMRPTLAGRRREPVARLAAALGLEYRVADVADAPTLDRMIDGHVLVLNCAGPFSRTALPVAEACMRQRVHYQDITGEIGVFEALAARDADARRAGVLLLPGVGFDVVPSDCLAAHVASRLAGATRLVIAIQSGGGMSRGTALTSLEGLAAGGGGGAIRRDGRITPVPPAWKTRAVDFGRGSVTVTTMPWGDVATAYHSTHIQNIEVYMAIPAALRLLMRHGRRLMPVIASAPVRSWLERRVRRAAAGPNADQRARSWSRFWAEASDGAGRTVSATLVAPGGYELTVRTALACARRAVAGDAPAGFHTPSTAYGPDLVLELEGVRRE